MTNSVENKIKMWNILQAEERNPGFNITTPAGKKTFLWFLARHVSRSVFSAFWSQSAQLCSVYKAGFAQGLPRDLPLQIEQVCKDISKTLWSVENPVKEEMVPSRPTSLLAAVSAYFFLCWPQYWAHQSVPSLLIISLLLSWPQVAPG